MVRGRVFFHHWLELSKILLRVPIFPKWHLRRFQQVTSRHSYCYWEPVKLHLVDGYVENKITRTSNTNNNNNASVLDAADKRSLSNIVDMPSKLDFSTLQAIAHQTGKFTTMQRRPSFIGFSSLICSARSEAGILMTSSEIEIGDIGMLSYRLPVAPTASTSHNQYQGPRRFFSCMDDSEQASLALKWELTSRTQVLTNDPLGLLNPVAVAPPANLFKQRTSSLVNKPFAHSNLPQSEVKPTSNSSSKEDEGSIIPQYSHFHEPISCPTEPEWSLCSLQSEEVEFHQIVRLGSVEWLGNNGEIQYDTLNAIEKPLCREKSFSDESTQFNARQ